MSGGNRPCGRVLIVDEDQGARARVSALLTERGYGVAEAETGEEALGAIRNEPPDLVILDVCLPGISGYEVCRRIREAHGLRPRVLFLSGVRTESFDRVAGLLLGADDYFIKPFAPDELIARVGALIRRGAVPVPETLANLTVRETEVLRLLAEGLTQKQVAAELTISPKTVGTHSGRIFEKLGVHSRAQAVAVALREEARV